MCTVPRTSTNHQRNATNSIEKVLIAALVLVAALAIGALAYVVKLSGAEVGRVAPVAIPTIGAIGSAAIGGIVVVLRKRPARQRA
ncbi:hypothetical protein [Micromonospora sp. DH14]|uniref:hypothetical protein n=1 Tax=Micromonospora sp. DH14 TaxID=3040120 RepID=UPI0024411B71|nr:hypothetical protein [Micromonospora sp. DH14]MDG9674817.1 hypothetical protein [Micromonospora sp. DH14]